MPSSALDPDPGHDYFFKIYGMFSNKAEFSNYFSSFSALCFMLKLNEPFKDQEIFIISLFCKSLDLVFLQFLVDILLLGSGSEDPHTFGNPDPDRGSLSLADPIDPDKDSDPDSGS